MVAIGILLLLVFIAFVSYQRGKKMAYDEFSSIIEKLILSLDYVDDNAKKVLIDSHRHLSNMCKYFYYQEAIGKGIKPDRAMVIADYKSREIIRIFLYGDVYKEQKK